MNTCRLCTNGILPQGGFCPYCKTGKRKAYLADKVKHAEFLSSEEKRRKQDEATERRRQRSREEYQRRTSKN